MNSFHQQGQLGNPQQQNLQNVGFVVNATPIPGHSAILTTGAGNPITPASYSSPTQGNLQPGYPQSNSGHQPSQTFAQGCQIAPQVQPQPAQRVYTPSLGQPNAQSHQACTPTCIGYSVLKSTPTVVPANPFEPRKDAEVLHKAMKRLGTDEMAIIRVLTKRSNDQRLKIAAEYKTLYVVDLESDMKSETSGNFKRLLMALMTPLPQFYAQALYRAIMGCVTDKEVLIEVLCTTSNSEIQAIKQAYMGLYGKMLEDDLRSDSSGNFKHLMSTLCMGNRSEEIHVNRDKARDDAKQLLKAGKLRLGTDESVFNEVLCTRSYPQLAAIFQEYQNLSGDDINQVIRSEFSGDLRKALWAIVKVVRNKPLFFAERLYKSMKGLGTNNRLLIRIMVTRCEVDLGDIADMFQFKYDKTLQNWIEGDCSGDYKKCLLGLLGLQ